MTAEIVFRAGPNNGGPNTFSGYPQLGKLAPLPEWTQCLAVLWDWTDATNFGDVIVQGAQSTQVGSLRFTPGGRRLGYIPVIPHLDKDFLVSMSIPNGQSTANLVITALSYIPIGPGDARSPLVVTQNTAPPTKRPTRVQYQPVAAGQVPFDHIAAPGSGLRLVIYGLSAGMGAGTAHAVGFGPGASPSGLWTCWSQPNTTDTVSFEGGIPLAENTALRANSNGSGIGHDTYAYYAVENISTGLTV